MATNSFSLPAINNSTSYNQPSYYNNTGSNFVADRDAFWSGQDQYSLPMKTEQQAETSTFWSNTGSVSKEWAGNVWDWANTETGSSVIGGAISGASQMYAQGKAEDAANKLSDDKTSIAQMQIDAQMEMQEKALAAQMEIAMLEENRIKAHNKSINNPDVKMNVRKFS
jgi:hypothetical protein